MPLPEVRRSKLNLILILVIFSLINGACQKNSSSNLQTGKFPPVMLWAWERPENLEFLDTDKYGVAFLAQTIRLSGENVNFVPRRQPLKVSPKTKLIAVTRVETARNGGDTPPSLSDEQMAKLEEYILKTLEMKNISGIQIDFDAKVSERDFYRKLLESLRQKLPKDIPLSITALASFCISDNWIKDLPVNEIVPMIFRMGADERQIREYLSSSNDFHIPLCQTSYGVAIDEALQTKFKTARRVYVFNVKSWTPKDVESLNF